MSLIGIRPKRVLIQSRAKLEQKYFFCFKIFKKFVGRNLYFVWINQIEKRWENKSYLCTMYMTFFIVTWWYIFMIYGYELTWLAASMHAQIITEKGAKLWSDTKLLASSATMNESWWNKNVQVHEPCRVLKAELKIMTHLCFISWT